MTAPSTRSTLAAVIATTALLLAGWAHADAPAPDAQPELECRRTVTLEHLPTGELILRERWVCEVAR